MNPVGAEGNMFANLFDKVPAKRAGKLEDIAGTVLYLCSQAGVSKVNRISLVILTFPKRLMLMGLTYVWMAEGFWLRMDKNSSAWWPYGATSIHERARLDRISRERIGAFLTNEYQRPASKSTQSCRIGRTRQQITC